MKDLAVKNFRGAERYNCAQAVLVSSEKHAPVEDAQLSEYSSEGSGRAKDGLCGALFSAKQMMQDETEKEAARNFFIKNAGSIHCREIRKAKRMTCHECVAAAAHLAEQSIKN